MDSKLIYGRNFLLKDSRMSDCLIFIFIFLIGDLWLNKSRDKKDKNKENIGLDINLIYMLKM